MKSIQFTGFLFIYMFVISFFSDLKAETPFFGSCLYSKNDICFDYRSGYSIDTAVQSCTRLGGIYDSSPCSSSKAIAKCEVSTAAEQLDILFYNTAWNTNDARTKCGLMKGVFY